MNAALRKNVRPLRVTEGREVFQERHFLCQVRHQIQKIKDSGQAQSDAEASAAKVMQAVSICIRR